MKRTWNWSCRKREYINCRSETLYFFLVFDPKALLLIHNQQTQIIELYICRKQAVRTNNNIDFSFKETFQNNFLFCIGPEAADDLNDEWCIFKAFDERFVMLLSQNCSWYQDSDLFFLLCSFECTAHGNFSFSKTYIATDKSVHWQLCFHVLLDRPYYFLLIRSLLKRKAQFKFTHFMIIRSKGKTLPCFAFSINLGKFFCNVIYCTCYFCTGFFPCFFSKFAKFWSSSVCIDILLYQVKFSNRHINFFFTRIDELHKFVV